MVGVQTQAIVQGIDNCLCAKVQQKLLCRESPHACCTGWLQHSILFWMPGLLSM